jgi:hypothetical protein
MIFTDDWTKFFSTANAYHAKWALIHQVLLLLLFGNVWIGVLAASYMYVSREITQTEYAIKNKHGYKTTKEALADKFNIDLEKFKTKHWNQAGVGGFVLPIVATFIFAVFFDLGIGYAS